MAWLRPVAARVQARLMKSIKGEVPLFGLWVVSSLKLEQLLYNLDLVIRRLTRPNLPALAATLLVRGKFSLHLIRRSHVELGEVVTAGPQWRLPHVLMAR